MPTDLKIHPISRWAPRQFVSHIAAFLPRGMELPDDVWRSRHRWFLVFLWIHVAAMPLVALGFGHPAGHAALAGLLLGVFPFLAGLGLGSRRLQASIVSLGFAAASGLLVHVSGGYIEMHFHYFVMVTFLTLYQDWVPFLVSIAFVGLQHGLLGYVLPHSVYNHADAFAHPWKWAAVHAAFISAASVGCIVAWKNIERGVEALRRAHEALQSRSTELAGVNDELRTEITERLRVEANLRQTEQQVREESQAMATLNRISVALSAELDLEKLVQAATDAGRQLAEAEFAAFFYNAVNDRGESYTLYTISGVPKEAFAMFPMPRNTELFGPTFRGEAVIRIGDVRKDPRYGTSPPHYGMPKGHLPVRSYLATPVTSRSGEVIGGLFFGHQVPHMFTERHERLVTGLAAQIAIAIDNARLYEAARVARQRAEAGEARSHELVMKLERSQTDLQDKISELTMFEEAVIGRELKMIEMERALEELRGRTASSSR